MFATLFLLSLLQAEANPVAPSEVSLPLDLSEDFELYAAWKGQATRLQAAGAKVFSKERTPEQVRLMGDLQIVSKSLSSLVHLEESDRPENYEEELLRMRGERQGFERELNRSLGLDVIMATPTIATILEAIPEDGVLVDYAVKEHVFVWTLTHKGDIQLHYLGKAPGVEEMSEAFLQDLVARRGGMALSTKKPADWNAPLFEAIWAPIMEDVKGFKKVLLCPDGFLGKLPFAVLQNEKGQYLLEDFDFIYLEDPTAHVKVLKETFDVDGSFLAVGNVDYGKAFEIDADEEEDWLAMAGDVDLRAAMGTTWMPLEATDIETRVLLGMHKGALKSKATRARLSGEAATEKRLKEEMAKYNYLHLATHGFFEPEELMNELPGLSAGLVCANANLEQKDGAEDGFLTAEEVALIDMQSCQMVVLSACETALGTVRAGEGLQSLRRSFGVAGVNTVVSSMWKVGDESTAELMKTFYKNLWVERQTRSQALRNAQLEMLQYYRDQGTDGHPSSWGAFVLSGDWR